MLLCKVFLHSWLVIDETRHVKEHLAWPIPFLLQSLDRVTFVLCHEGRWTRPCFTHHVRTVAHLRRERMVAHDFADTSFFVLRGKCAEQNPLLGPSVAPVDEVLMKPRFVMAALIIQSQAETIPDNLMKVNGSRWTWRQRQGRKGVLVEENCTTCVMGHVVPTCEKVVVNVVGRLLQGNDVSHSCNLFLEGIFFFTSGPRVPVVDGEPLLHRWQSRKMFVSTVCLTRSSRKICGCSLNANHVLYTMISC